MEAVRVESKLLDADTVATKLGVSKNVVKKWCREGLFPHAVKLAGKENGAWVIPDSDLGSEDVAQKVMMAHFHGKLVRKGRDNARLRRG
jgi:predicted DNA-binding transcriptional regulator AlpA